MERNMRIKLIGFTLAGLVALLALMAIAMTPSAYGDEGRFITLDQDSGYTGDSVHFQVRVYEWTSDDGPETAETVISVEEYRQSGSFLSPGLETVPTHAH